MCDIPGNDLVVDDEQHDGQQCPMAHPSHHHEGHVDEDLGKVVWAGYVVKPAAHGDTVGRTLDLSWKQMVDN